MEVSEQIASYIDSQPEPKRSEMKALHESIVGLFTDCELSYFDGRNEQGKIVMNPNIGYGKQMLHYADGSTKEFYQIGLSGNTGGFSIFIMGLKDRNYLSEKYGKTIGKGTVTTYCIKFKRVGDIDRSVLMEAIRDGIEQTRG